MRFYVYVSIRLIEYTGFYVYVSIRLIEYTCFYVHVSIRLIVANKEEMDYGGHTHSCK